MRRLSFGVLLIALSTLMIELMLTRAFDVILVPNLSYFVVTSAVFAFGLAGIYATLRPIAAGQDIQPLLVSRSVAFAITTAVLVPLINWLPLDYTRIGSHTLRTIAAFLVLYVALILPFFLAGSVLIAMFTRYAQRIQRLYFWDLIGAGIGSVIVVPFMVPIGPGGLILCAAALAFLAAALFARARATTYACVLLAVGMAAVPFLKAPKYIDFVQHVDKRGVKEALAQGRGELVRWDPISKITIIDETWSPAISEPWHRSGDRKAIQYDNGNQSSYFYKFNGDLKGLRAKIDRDKSHVDEQFWDVGVLASHYLKRDSGQSVLVIGSAGGQETKAALMYGAAHVDAIELVPTVVKLGLGRYSSYIGNFFADPRVHVEAGEGRSFLRHSQRTYDIIQMFSNYTSSSIAQGTGALSPEYLQTAEAYEEYFSHLSADGVLQINHIGYPRMIATAALAWKRMGRTEFARHVLVYTCAADPTMPLLLIKMQPWTAAEVQELSTFLAPPELDAPERMQMVEDPLDPSQDFLSPDFYSGTFPQSLAQITTANMTPRTDDLPYFGMLRKTMRQVQPNRATFLDAGTAYILNAQLVKGVPMDWIHLFFTGFVSVVFVVLFVLVPLRFSAVGRQQGATAVPLLLYFSCLGAGFIALELVFIQKFTHLIGSPLYTYSTVIFTMLFAAGIGSSASEKLGISMRRRWGIPFIAILLIGTVLMFLYPSLFRAALALPLPGRALASGAMIFPLAFFLGMPFPLGILAIADRPAGAVAWAWGMNGLFTVAGGLLSILLSMFIGFDLTIGIALGLYALAFAVFPVMRPAQQPVMEARYAVEAG